MLRKTVLRPFGGAATAATDALPAFVVEVRRIKAKFRGRAQYADAEAAAKVVFDQYVPRDESALKSWLNAETSSAALNASQFFEYNFEQRDAVVAWARENIVNFEVDAMLTCGIALSHLDPSSKEILSETVLPKLVEQLDTVPSRCLQDVFKLAQRCNCTDKGVWEKLADEFLTRKEDPARAGSVRSWSSYMRILAGTSRYLPRHRVNDILVGEILGQMKGLKTFDFSTFVASMHRLHIVTPLDPTTFQRLLSRTSANASQFTCRDMASILKALVKIRMTLNPTVPTEQRRVIDSCFDMVLQQAERNLGKFMDRGDSKYWKKPQDVITAVFSLESSNALSNSNLMRSFAKYVEDNINELAPGDTAIAAGVLRRTGYLQDDIVRCLASRIQEQLDAFHIEELAHIAATFATRKEFLGQSWIDELEEIVEERVKSGSPGCSPAALLNLTAAFPLNAILRLQNFKLEDCSPRHMCDTVSVVAKGSPFRHTLTQAINSKFAADAAFTNHDIARLSKIDLDGAIHSQAQAYVKRRLEAEVWEFDTLFLLPLMKDRAVRSKFVDAAVKAARVHLRGAAITLQHACSVLADVFGPVPQVKQFVREAGDVIVQGRTMQPIVLHLALALRYREFMPDAEWFDYFVFNPLSKAIRRMSFTNIVRVLEFIKTRAPLDQKYADAVRVILECGITAAKASGDDASVAGILVAVKKIGLGVELPTADVEAALLSPSVPHGLKAELGGGSAVEGTEKVERPSLTTLDDDELATSATVVADPAPKKATKEPPKRTSTKGAKAAPKAKKPTAKKLLKKKSSSVKTAKTATKKKSSTAKKVSTKKKAASTKKASVKKTKKK